MSLLCAVSWRREVQASGSPEGEPWGRGETLLHQAPLVTCLGRDWAGLPGNGLQWVVLAVHPAGSPGPSQVKVDPCWVETLQVHCQHIGTN